jgi:HEAT repeat protein
MNNNNPTNYSDLLERLDSKDPSVRLQATTELTRLTLRQIATQTNQPEELPGVPRRIAVQIAYRLDEEIHTDIRRELAYALGVLSNGDNTIEDKMIIEEKLIASAVQDNDPHTRENAIEALMKSKPLLAVVPFIQIATQDSDEDVRARALYALADYLEDPNLPKQYFDQVLDCLRHVRDQNNSPYLQRLARGVITLHEVK